MPYNANNRKELISMNKSIEKATDEMLASMNNFVLKTYKFREEVLSVAVNAAKLSSNVDKLMLCDKYSGAVIALSYILEDIMNKTVEIVDYVTEGKCGESDYDDIIKAIEDMGY